MRRGIFARIFVVYALVMLVAAVFIEIYITSMVRDNYVQQLRRGLEVQIDLMADGFSFGGKQDDLCRLLKTRTGSRVTAVAADGRVVGDSDTDSSAMENHRSRVEIEQALFASTGMAVRHSATLQYDLLYVAKRIDRRGETEGFIRLSVPLRDVDGAVNVLRLRIGVAVGLVLLGALAVFLWQTDRLRRLLGQLREFSRALARGEIGRRLFLDAAPEFDAIAADLNAMSATLQTMMTENEEEKNRLGVILRSIPDALLIIDRKGIVRITSASAAEVFGQAQPTGQQFLEVVRNDDFAGLVEKVGRTQSAVKSEIRLAGPTERHLSVQVSPLFYWERELAGFVAVFHDITRIKQLEEVRKDFVANVSHEIKTPVTAIRGFADTLLDGALEDRQDAVRFLGMIRANSDRINSLVDDLMTISKIELGVIRVERTQVDAAGAMESVAATLRPRAEEKGLSLKVEVQPDAALIEADRNRLVQILTNLLDNALKFTEEGGVTCGIRRRDGGSEIYVSDTGIGIPPKHLYRLGERFYRVDPARSRKLGGTGLGLAIVKHLVKAHGWSMHIESRPGTGTTVHILL